MREYKKLIRDILYRGEYDRPDRTGTGTHSLFGEQIHIDLKKGFPLLTLRKISFRTVVLENLWFLRGDETTDFLLENNCFIWQPWVDKNNYIGPIYGPNWRRWITHNGLKIDQVAELISGIKEKPYSRRHVISSWNPAYIGYKVLDPCHVLWQFYVSKFGFLSCHLYMRSCDSIVGLPHNIAGYALLTFMIGHLTGYKPGELTISFGDVHVYKPYVEKAKELIEREDFKLPTLEITREHESIDDFDINSFKLHDYKHHPAMKFEVFV